MFVGIALEGSNKKYSQTTERPVRISMAALDPFQSHGKLFSMCDSVSNLAFNLRSSTVTEKMLDASNT